MPTLSHLCATYDSPFTALCSEPGQLFGILSQCTTVAELLQLWNANGELAEWCRDGFVTKKLNIESDGNENESL